MIKDDTLKEMELYFDTGRMVTDACLAIKKLYREVPFNVLHALNRIYSVSDELEEALIAIGEGYDQAKHDYVVSMNEVSAVQYKEALKYADGLLDRAADAFDCGRVSKTVVTKSLNTALWRVNHNLHVLKKMTEEEK